MEVKGHLFCAQLQQCPEGPIRVTVLKGAGIEVLKATLPSCEGLFKLKEQPRVWPHTETAGINSSTEDRDEAYGQQTHYILSLCKEYSLKIKLVDASLVAINEVLLSSYFIIWAILGAL